MAHRTVSSPSSSGLVIAGPGRLLGFFVNSTTSGSLTFYDNTSATGAPLGNTMTPAAGNFYPFPVDFNVALYISIANTLTVSVFVEV